MKQSPMIGRRIGKYEITGEIGRGGMGIVYEAVQTTLSRKVAIKMLPYHLAGAEEFLSRFLREAETLARLNHENVVHVYDIEEVDANHFIIMEYVGGPPLSKLLKMHGHLSPGMARDIGAAIASGLAAAHRKGIVHRDIKPDNILFTLQGRPKLTDFGIAHAEDTRFKTQTGTTMGTPYYISPEQAQGRQVTEQSDLYSLGVVLYEMLAGRRPFEAENSLMIFMKHLQESPPPLLEQVPDLPPEFAAVVHRALAKEPTDRMESAEDLASQLMSLDAGATPGMALRIEFPQLAEAEVYRTLIDRGSSMATHTPPVLGTDSDATRDPREAEAEAANRSDSDLSPPGEDAEDYPTRRISDEERERVFGSSGSQPSLQAARSRELGNSGPRKKAPPLGSFSAGGAAAVDGVPELSQSWIRRTFSPLVPKQGGMPWPLLVSALVGAVVVFFGVRGLIDRFGEEPATGTQATGESADVLNETPAPLGEEISETTTPPSEPAPQPTPEQQGAAVQAQILAQPDEPSWSAGMGRAQVALFLNRFRQTAAAGEIDELLAGATPLGQAHLQEDLIPLLQSTRDRDVRYSNSVVEFEGQRMARVRADGVLRGVDTRTGDSVEVREMLRAVLLRDGDRWLIHEFDSVER